MRELVLKYIQKNFEKGLDEVCGGWYREYTHDSKEYREYMVFNDRHQKEIEDLLNTQPQDTRTATEEEKFWVWKDKYNETNKRYAQELIELLEKYPDELLLGCLLSQECQDCR